MQEFSVSDLTVPQLLAAVAKGEKIRLCEAGREVAVVMPSPKAKPPGKPFVEFVQALREKYDMDRDGFTKEEVDSWRDKSPGRESPF